MQRLSPTLFVFVHLCTGSATVPNQTCAGRIQVLGLSQDLLVEDLPVHVKRSNKHTETNIVILNHTCSRQMASDVTTYM